MCSRTGYKCQIWHTDSLGYGKYHVIRTPKIFRPECYFFSFSNMAAIKNRCFSQICHILNINDFLSNLSKLVYHIHSRVNIKFIFQISRSMSRSMLHFEHGNLIITILFCYYLNFESVHQALKGHSIFSHNLATRIFPRRCEMKYNV